MQHTESLSQREQLNINSMKVDSTESFSPHLKKKKNVYNFCGEMYFD